MTGVRRSALLLLSAWSALPLLASCAERRVDPSLEITTTSAAVTVPGAPTTAPEGSAFVARVAAVDTADLRLGAAFNTQFLALQFLAVGLEPTEANCAAGRVAEASGPDFEARPVSQVMTGAGITPDVLLPCVPTERMMELSQAGAVDFARVPVDVLRSTLTELASAGYESVGMTAIESSCLADRVVGAYADEDLRGLLTSLSLPADRAVRALPGCVTAERADQLGG